MDRTLEALALVRGRVVDSPFTKVVALAEARVGSTLLVDLQPSTPTVWVCVNDDATHAGQDRTSGVWLWVKWCGSRQEGTVDWLQRSRATCCCVLFGNPSRPDQTTGLNRRVQSQHRPTITSVTDRLYSYTPIMSNQPRRIILGFDGIPLTEGLKDRLLEAAISHNALDPQAASIIRNSWTQHTLRYAEEKLLWFRDIASQRSTPSPTNPWGLGFVARRFSQQMRRWHDALSLQVLDNFISNDKPPAAELEWALGKQHYESVGRLHGYRIGFPLFMNALVGLAEQNSPPCRWDVVSTEWSADQIRGVLNPWISRLKEGRHAANRTPMVVANKIRAMETPLPPRYPQLVLYSSIEQRCHIGPVLDAPTKLRAALGLIEMSGGTDSSVIFIGCSVDDHDCLVQFGGVLVRNNTVGASSTLELLERAGYTIPHIGSWTNQHICWASDFSEVISTGYLIDRLSRRE